MPGEARPLIDIQEQFGDLDARQQPRRLVDQRLGRDGCHRVQRRDFQACLGEDGIGQGVGRRQTVDRLQACGEQSHPLGEVLFAVGGHGQRRRAARLERREGSGREQVLVKILELIFPREDGHVGVRG